MVLSGSHKTLKVSEYNLNIKVNNIVFVFTGINLRIVSPVGAR